MELDCVQLIIVVPAFLTIIWAVVSFTVERQTKQKEERKQLSALYVNPFLLACEELQSRIYNFLVLHGLGALRAQDPELSYAEETLYLIAQYFGWERRIFRYGPYAQDTEVFQRTEAIRATFATNRVRISADTREGGTEGTPGKGGERTPRGSGEGTPGNGGVPFCFYRYQQKAIAQFILQSSEGPAGPEAETIPYLDFKQRLGELQDSLPSVDATIRKLKDSESASDLGPLVRGRLAEVQNHLVMLLAYLEKQEEFTLSFGERDKAPRQEDWKAWAKRRPWHALLGEEVQATGEASDGPAAL